MLLSPKAFESSPEHGEERLTKLLSRASCSTGDNTIPWGMCPDEGLQHGYSAGKGTQHAATCSPWLPMHWENSFSRSCLVDFSFLFSWVLIYDILRSFEFSQVHVFMMPIPSFFSKHLHPGLPAGFALAKAVPTSPHHEWDSPRGSWEGKSLSENSGWPLLLNTRCMEGAQCS